MPTEDIYNIKKPLIKDDKWLIFPDTIFSQISTMDCNDTMEGQCYVGKSFDDCVKSCEQSPECNYGYYISDLPGKGKKDNICVPLKDHSNPMYRLRKKDIYPVMDHAKTKVFINKQKYYFPPEQANTVFYMDNFTLQNVDTGMFLETSPMSDKSNNGVKFDKNGDLIVQIIQIPEDLAAGTQYVPVKYGDPIVFNIPNTTLIIGSTMEWIQRSYSVTSDIAYKILPLTPGKNIGDDISYSDTFTIHTNINILGIVKNSSFEKLYKSNNGNVVFRFIPKMKGWYCNNNNECTEIPLEKMVVNDKGIGTYNGLAIGRNPGCWGVCKYKIQDQPHLKPFDIYNENTTPIFITIIITITILVTILITILILIKHV